MSLHGKNVFFQVENDFRELSFKVFIRVPVMLGDKSIWTNKSIQVSMNVLEKVHIDSHSSK